MKKINEIWKDPVWSKVISAIIIGLFTIAYNYAISKINNESFKQTFKNFWKSKFELWQVGILVVALLIISIIFYKRKNKPIDNPFEEINIENLSNMDYTEDHKILDIGLFNKIRNEYLTDNEVSWLREQDFNFGFNRNIAFTFFNLTDKIHENPNFEFFNEEIEEFKNKLIKSVQIFNHNLSNETYPSGEIMQSVPKEWRLSNPEKFNYAVTILNQSKKELLDTYDSFIRAGRRTLRV